MYHGIRFEIDTDSVNGEPLVYNTYEDFHLIPTTRPVVNPPEVKTKYVDIPGANGHLDLTEALTGYPLYNSRSGSIEFAVENDSGDTWSYIYKKCLEALHGKRGRMLLDDDSSYYYEGRFGVDEWKSDKNYSLITLTYDVDPYKFDLYTSIDDWLWDPFDFEQGVIQESLRDIRVDNDDEGFLVTVYGLDKPITPAISVAIDEESTMEVLADSYSERISLRNGRNESPYIVLKGEESHLRFFGHGTVTIEFRRGML